VISAKFGPIVKRLGAHLLGSEQLNLVREDSFVYHTLLHEMAHALGACYVGQTSEKNSLSINEALRERYSTIEECRADLVGMVFLNLLADRGFLPEAIKAAAAVTFVVNSVRSLRFGTEDDYSRGAAISLSYCVERGSLSSDRNGHLHVSPERLERHVRELAEMLQNIAIRGDYRGAGELIETFGGIPDKVERLRRTIGDIPIDLEFLQEESAV
jgi:hypothetical protein